MRVNEQIDALDIMGVNSLNYLVLPKLLFAVLEILSCINYSINGMYIAIWKIIALTLSGLVSTKHVLGLRSFLGEISGMHLQSVLFLVLSLFLFHLFWLLYKRDQ